MRPSFRNLFVPAALLTLAFPFHSHAQQTDSATFELHGTVINGATGQPVSGALVQLNGDRPQFSGSEGTFAFSDVARGRYMITARKPGFFTRAEVTRGNDWSDSLTTVPYEGDVTVKVFPEAIIYGEVKNEAGDPVEGITVGVQRWETTNGHRQLQPSGESTTDDEGNFRISELTPGSYYVSFNHADRHVIRRVAARLRNVKLPGEGFGLQYYPGVADASSATPVTVRAGAQFHVSQILTQLRLFQISGMIPAADLDGGFNVNLFNSSGANVPSSTRLNAKTGEFRIVGVPAGNYLLSAHVWRPATDDNENRSRPLTAWLQISVNSDISGLVLPFGNSVSIPIQIQDETSGANSSGPHRVYVEMSSKDFPQLSRGAQAPHIQNDEENAGRIEDLAPATYSVEAHPQFPGYVADLRCGSVDLLRDDLTVTQGASLPDIEVTVRDDGAELDGAITENGQPASGNVIIYSQAYPKRSVLMPASQGTFSAINLPPGAYQVVAVKDASDLEFTNPAAVQKFLTHATSITLGPRDKSAVQLEVQLEGQQSEAQP